MFVQKQRCACLCGNDDTPVCEDPPSIWRKRHLALAETTRRMRAGKTDGWRKLQCDGWRKRKLRDARRKRDAAWGETSDGRCSGPGAQSGNMDANTGGTEVGGTAGQTNCYDYDKFSGEIWQGEGPTGKRASGEEILRPKLVSPPSVGNTGVVSCTCRRSRPGDQRKEPLGYKVDDTKLKRAGLDYWPYPFHLYVVVKIHGSWTEFREYFALQEGEKRLLAFTKRGTNIHSEFSYRRGDWLVFGSETCGLPPDALQDCVREGMGGGTIRIPMVETYVRCLNLSVSVGISLYEAARQLNYQQLQFPAANEGERLFITEDIFG
ncbi:hypothetical protein KSP39_PZI000069 [Platanthera zijinensis]|uniref:tRNA/rRNA methyltransferase SpoU type domain-containing protein n=1 Tax=Platanthera zijinensis TaxID=2320716 RepID=A0AAP0C1S6_9ASPA